jgi:hypothetical protein
MLTALLLLAACTTPSRETSRPDPGDTVPTGGLRVDVVDVTWAGEEGAWVFTVSLRSPDIDCDQYADWWELLSPEGTLLYRRILNHSHADEQPVARSGDPLDIASDQRLVARGHGHPFGYGGVAMSGSMATGFTADPSITADFASTVETQEPLPTECWW